MELEALPNRSDSASFKAADQVDIKALVSSLGACSEASTTDTLADGDYFCEPRTISSSPVWSRQCSDEKCSYSELSRQCTEVDAAISEAAGEHQLLDVIEAAYCITIQDPRQPTCPFIAISEAFEAMTGYSAGEMLGHTSRLLQEDAIENAHLRVGLHGAQLCGKSFTGLLVNTRRDGRPFLKLLHQRGLTVARNTETGEDLWFLVSIQADVSDVLDFMDQDELEERIPEMDEYLQKVRDEVTGKIPALALTGAVMSDARMSGSSDFECKSPAGSWEILGEPLWR